MSAFVPFVLPSPVLQLFKVVGESALLAIAKQINSPLIFYNRTISNKAEDCFRIVTQRPVQFQYQIVQSGHWHVTVTGVPHDLVRTGSLSPAVPRYAWVNSAIHCLHGIYHMQNVTILERKNTGERGQSNIMVSIRLQHKTYRDMIHMAHIDKATQQLKDIMHNTWMRILGFGGLCGVQTTSSTTKPCAMKSHWAINDLNAIDQNDVPNLICNKVSCISSQSPSESRLPHNHMNRISTKELLLTSGWAYKLHSVSGIPDESRRLFDWYKFFYEHFHLGWFKLQYQQNKAQRVQLFSVFKRKSDVSTLNQANAFIVGIVLIVNVVFIGLCVWSFL